MLNRQSSSSARSSRSSGGSDALGTGVDLDRGAVLRAGLEHGPGVEARLLAPPAAAAAVGTPLADQPAGAVAEHVGVRVAHGGEHPPGHRRRLHLQLGVHAGHDDVDLGEQLVGLVQRAVVVDVDLDAGEQPERRELLVELGDQRQLLAQPLRRQPAGHREPRRVVGQRRVVVPERLARSPPSRPAGSRRRSSRSACAGRPAAPRVPARRPRPAGRRRPSAPPGTPGRRPPAPRQPPGRSSAPRR